ncbi:MULTISPECIES: hypothetical protein [unclassified Streptomyces]|uniref:hypothetical protein n=1 Tax=unclassified Streptomyces TaxID=2593676 RepID=UPI0036883176
MGSVPLRSAPTTASAGLPRGPAYDPWRTWRSREGAEGIVAAGILAANARNVQPWRFVLEDGPAVRVYADPDRRQGALDPFDRELYVGLGCALENMVLAGRARGYAPRVLLRPDTGDPAHAATVLLEPGEAGAGTDELYEAIPYRRTNRGPFRPEPLPEALLKEIAALGEGDLAAPALRWFAGPAERDRVAAQLAAATEEIVADEEQSLAGHRWFRGSDREVDRSRDGMTVDTQGMPPLMSALGKRLPAPPRRVADRFWLRRTRQVHLPTAAAFGMVTVPDATRAEDRLEGGRLLQRVHLFATARGLAVGHLNMMTVRADRERELGLPPRFGRILADLVGDPGRQALVTFRIGRPAQPAVASPRRPVAAVLDRGARH